MTSTLHDLIAPLSEAEFLADLSARSLAFCRGSDEHRFEGLLDWDTFCGVIESGAFPPEKLRVTQKGNPVDPLFYLKMGKVHAGNLAELLDGGASAIAVPLHSCVPALNALCGDIRSRIAEETYAGANATTGHGDAFRLHFDPQDLIILQLEGSKRWTVFGPPVAVPVGRDTRPAAPRSRPLFDKTLRSGDFLFVPAGYWHDCENGPGRSLHVGVFIEPATGWHAFNALVS